MATEVSEQLQWTADQIVHHSGYPSAVLSGIAPDPAHLDGGGFHCSIDDLYAHGNGDDYSNTRPDDKGFNPHYGAAIDVSLSQADMVRAYHRIRSVWADESDPRRRYVNAINCWSGSGDATRFDFWAGTAKYASPDHKWHTHTEIHRRYVLDQTAASAVVSIYQGVSRQDWLASTQQEDDMNLGDTIGSETHSGRTLKQFLNDQADLRGVWVGDKADTAHAKLSPSSPLAKILALPAQVSALTAAVTALSGKDFTDENAIIAGVLAGLSPERIAAAIPQDMAEQVADILAQRLQS